MITRLKLIFAAPLILVMGGSAFAQPEHTVVQHGKEQVCPVPAEKKEAVVTPVRQENDTIFTLINTLCYDGPEFKPVFSAGHIPGDYKLFIFDRWGEMYFESHDPEKGWDGYKKGEHQMLPEWSTYVYLITFVDSKGEKHKYSGRITVTGWYCHCG